MDKDNKITIFDLVLLKLHNKKVCVYINKAAYPVYGVLYYSPELCKFNVELKTHDKDYGTFSAYAKDITCLEIDVDKYIMIHV